MKHHSGIMIQNTTVQNQKSGAIFLNNTDILYNTSNRFPNTTVLISNTTVEFHNIWIWIPNTTVVNHFSGTISSNSANKIKHSPAFRHNNCALPICSSAHSYNSLNESIKVEIKNCSTGSRHPRNIITQKNIMNSKFFYDIIKYYSTFVQNFKHYDTTNTKSILTTFGSCYEFTVLFSDSWPTGQFRFLFMENNRWNHQHLHPAPPHTCGYEHISFHHHHLSI